ncbi:MAG: MBL fold metallo-hydrolase [Fimbriimonadaceae bacterium]|nr:MBL fold metallo-hydrolase [Fimbriimonadaceae bacterium]
MAIYKTVARSGGELLRSIAEASPALGEAVFWWLGQHTVILKMGATRVFIDPYLKPSERRNKPPLLTPAQCGEFDLVLGTHDHSDHLDPDAIPGIAAASQAIFITSTAHRRRMLDLGVPEARWIGLQPGESATVKGVTVTAVKACHEFFDETPEGLFPHLGFVVEGSGVRAYHSGDTVWWEGLQAELRRRLPLDVAFVPINGRDAPRYRRNCLGNMGFAEAADLICQLPVGLAVPTHFDMFDGNLEEPEKFIDFVVAKYPGQPTWLGAAGEPVLLRAKRQAAARPRSVRPVSGVR